MTPSSPSQEEWRALYQAAGRFYEQKPWTWLYEEQIFGVVNPEDGEVGYCSVMGCLGQHLALAVYPGVEGLGSYLALCDAEEDTSDAIDAYIDQKSLQASFEDRDALTDRDRQVIRSLGLKFRGRQAWPLFRDFRPGYAPWYLTAPQARFLTLALEQTVELATRFRDHPEELGVKGGRCLVRIAPPTPEGQEWTEEWRPLPTEFPLAGLAYRPDDRAIHLLQQQSPHKKRRGALELDYFYLPGLIGERGERPYYIRQVLIVDHGSGFIVGQELVVPGTLGQAVLRVVQEGLQAMEVWPRQIGVRREELAVIIEDLVVPLGIEIILAEHLPMMEEVRQMLESFFRGEPLFEADE